MLNLLTNSVPTLTDVQVRVYNSQYNKEIPFEIELSKLSDYLDHIRKEPKDFQGKLTFHKFAHLPLVSFVDVETREELVFNKDSDLPTSPTNILNSNNKIIASFL